MRASLPLESKRCDTDGRSVYGPHGRLYMYVENKPHSVKLTIASQSAYELLSPSSYCEIIRNSSMQQKRGTSIKG